MKKIVFQFLFQFQLNEGQIYEKVNKINMNGLQDLQDKLFLDIQNIIQDLSEVNTLEALLQDEYLIKELAEKTAFLKLSQAFDLEKMLSSIPTSSPEQSEFSHHEPEFIISNPPHQEEINSDSENFDLLDNQILAEAHHEEMIDEKEEIDEEIDENNDDELDLSDNEMFKDDEADDIKPIEVLSIEPEEPLDEKPEKSMFEAQEESQFSFAMEKAEVSDYNVEQENKDQFISEISISEHTIPTIDERISDKEKAFLESEERRKQIIENSQHFVEDSTATSDEKIIEIESSDNDAQEKKFKLANIKGVSKTLFDDDQLSEKHLAEDTKVDTGSLIKNNMPTDIMEAPKPRQEFRLDLNDKIAFTQHLFNNSQMDLNHVINRLNDYDNLEDAKEFLSDLYYERNWNKVDSYAQRLWTLVENKFL